MTISIIAIVLILLLFTSIMNHLFHHWLNNPSIHPMDKGGIALLYCILILLTLVTVVSLFQDILNT